MIMKKLDKKKIHKRSYINVKGKFCHYWDKKEAARGQLLEINGSLSHVFMMSSLNMLSLKWAMGTKTGFGRTLG